MQAVPITNVFEVDVAAVVRQLGTAQDIFTRCTPSCDSARGKPTGWEVLSTMELLFQVGCSVCVLVRYIDDGHVPETRVLLVFFSFNVANRHLPHNAFCSTCCC